MYIKKDKMVSSFKELENILSGYKLPSWEELPYIELYMDQVISIINTYLEIYYRTLGSETLLTPSMINNYVKLGIIPHPLKKRYSKVHLAYLIMICTLKQTLDMATIQKIIPSDLGEENICGVYNSFVKNQHKAFLYVTESIKAVADPIFALEGDNQERMNDLLMQVASSANIFKILTQRITSIEE